ncbi:MAG: hypothetical protein ACI9YL_001954 [Luteibaculaceae bacterium]
MLFLTWQTLFEKVSNFFIRLNSHYLNSAKSPTLNLSLALPLSQSRRCGMLYRSKAAANVEHFFILTSNKMKFFTSTLNRSS